MSWVLGDQGGTIGTLRVLSPCTSSYLPLLPMATTQEEVRGNDVSGHSDLSRNYLLEDCRLATLIASRVDRRAHHGKRDNPA